MDLKSFQRPHLIGIGGIGVSGVARALNALGYDVRGTDVRESSITRALAEEGIRVTIGQKAENLDDADVVVYSTAVPETNPERKAAAERVIPVVHRSEILGALTASRPSIGIIGTHGKGTVAAMITWLLECAGMEPSFIIGGILENFGTNTRFRPDGWLVAEVDESDGSLINVPTRVVLLNNLEADHLNYYKNGLEDILAQVRRYLRANRIVERVFANADDRGAVEAMARARASFVSFGIVAETPAFRATDVAVDGLGTRFTLWRRGERLGDVRLAVPGQYNVNNAVGAVAVADSLGVPFETIAEGLATFRGLENRFTVVETGRVRVIKDYISHPTGIRRVLAAAKASGGGPIVGVFKPYRFTMIHYLAEEYATAFQDAQRAVVTELYTAGEVPIPGVDAGTLCDSIRATGTPVEFVPEMDDIVPWLLENVPDGHQVIFFGGDDLFVLADEYARRLQSEEA